MTHETRRWAQQELDLLGGAPLIRVAAERADGSLRPFTMIGHVRVDGDEVVRSLRGTAGAWYRGALRTGLGRIEVDGRRIAIAFIPDDGRADVVDAAFRSRYGNDSGVQAMTRSPARDATLVIRPLRSPAEPT